MKLNMLLAFSLSAPFRKGAIRPSSVDVTPYVRHRNSWPWRRRDRCGLFENRSEKMFKIIFWRYDCHLVEDKAMPYSPKHKRDTREKILESARRLFNRNGYSGVSIDEIMTDAGLTHGGFYRHFSGKDELYAAAVRQFLCKKAPAPWQKQREPNSGHEV